MKTPTLAENETLLYNAPGPVVRRTHHSVTYESYNLSLVKHHSHYALLVHHGAGQERVNLGTLGRYLESAVRELSSLEAFAVLFEIYKAHSQATRNARDATAAQYRQAFAENRLKKRKVRGQDRVKIWIESPIQS